MSTAFSPSPQPSNKPEAYVPVCFISRHHALTLQMAMNEKSKDDREEFEVKFENGCYIAATIEMATQIREYLRKRGPAISQLVREVTREQANEHVREMVRVRQTNFITQGSLTAGDLQTSLQDPIHSQRVENELRAMGLTPTEPPDPNAKK